MDQGPCYEPIAKYPVTQFSAALFHLWDKADRHLLV